MAVLVDTATVCGNMFCVSESGLLNDHCSGRGDGTLCQR